MAGNWWTRPCGGREVLALAVPLIVSMSSWTIMNFCDRMFLLWHSTDEMAAAMPSGMLHFTMLCFFFGMAGYVNTFVAQYYGAGRWDRIGAAVWQGVWLGVFTTPLFLAAIPLAPWLFAAMGHEPHLAELEATYFQICCCGAGAEVIAAALSSFFSGRGQTRVVMAVDFSAALLNIVLCYLLIFGKFGLAEMGIAGAAWATVISLWMRVVAYAWLALRPHERAAFGILRGWRLDRVLCRRLFRFGSPAGAQMFMEVASFSAFLFLVGWFGEQTMAATVMTFNVNNLAWVPMWGLGIAVTTIVGQQIGAHRPEMGARATWTAFWMSQAYLSLMAVLYVVVPDAFLFGHAAGSNPARFAALRETAVILLRYVAVYSLFDSVNLIFVSALKGAGDTPFILRTTALMSPLPIILAYVGVRWFEADVYWCFLVLTTWIIALALIYTVRFMQGRWRRMRVIEPDVARDERDGAGPAAERS